MFIGYRLGVIWVGGRSGYGKQINFVQILFLILNSIKFGWVA